MKKVKIFIACDTKKISEAKRIIAQTKNSKLDVGYKFGLEFFYAKKNREFLSKLKGERIFLDLKLNDIPATCVAAIKSLNDLKNVNYITLHANAGEETVKAAQLDEEKSLIAKFGEGATKSGATLKGIFEKAMGKKNKKGKKE